MITKTLDRMLFISYLRSYLIVLTSMLSLYVIVDLFTNLDDFSKRGFVDNFLHIGSYYAVHLAQIFDRLSELIALLGAMFTVAWMQRNNELLPQLCAGISTRRVVRSVLLGSAITLSLGPLSQELIIPRISDELEKPRDDPKMERAVEVRGSFDNSGIHMEGAAGFRNERRVVGMSITFPPVGSSGMVHVYAKEAVYYPPTDSQSGGWMLYQVVGEDIPDPLPDKLERLGPNKYFLRTNDLDFDSATRGSSWYLFCSTWELRRILAKPDTRRQPGVAVVFHMRFTRPLVGVILVLMGLGIILRDQNKNVFVNAGLCLVLSAIFYVAVFGCKFLGENDVIPPALAAWLPVLIFGPFSVTLFDAIHT
jgi:lipopolysaccharide export system permease protein